MIRSRSLALTAVVGFTVVVAASGSSSNSSGSGTSASPSASAVSLTPEVQAKLQKVIDDVRVQFKAPGLQAGVWSSNLNRAHRVARALKVGTVHVNQYDDDDLTVPFGGYKQSGNGRDKSLHAFEKYTELKTTWLRIDAA